MIGLDACDPALAQQFAKDGVMPNLAKLLETGSRAPVDNPFGLFVGALWVSFGTALRPDRHAFHCWSQIDPATYEYRLNTPSIAHIPQFWSQISDGGKRVAVIDVPHMIANKSLNGFQILEWGCHDKHHGFHSSPAELAKLVEADFGLHPALKGEEVYGAADTAPDDWVHRAGWLRTRDEDCALLRDMLAGAEQKQKMTTTLMRDGDWDFFCSVFGESHAIGHQQWHLHDPRHPRHDAETVTAMGGDPLVQVYGALDRALGEIEREMPKDALLLVHLSHGMGPHFDGDHLLEEILVRLDRHGRAGQSAQADEAAAPPAASALRTIARAVRVPKSVRLWVGRTFFSRPSEADNRSRQRFFKEPNNTVHGGVRLNLMGREPRGCVRPEEVDALIAEITEGLLELVNVDTGKPVIRGVERCERWHKRSPTDTMPDLFLDWERSALVETVTSPRIGTLHGRYNHWRTGDHRPAGLLLAKGEGFAPGVRMPGLAVEDIGPSIAARLGVELRDVDGRAADWLVRPGLIQDRGAVPSIQ
ncbi:alkaline phosphatase family protein [Phenylobacterium sp. LjRoot225]|uniref:alkaline phosphatase family protein n=1 Tax=Phenylobacterium sp. LjRoot225 TaxID=3342285 RepID=UPI003ECC982D